MSGMESQKKQLLPSLLVCNISEEMCGQLTAAMKELEAEARRCYSSTSNHIHSDTFREMMLTDAAFIIHTFRCFDTWCKNPSDPKLQCNSILNTPWNAPNVCEDLLMLENQLPFFVLVKVYAILTNESNEEKSENSLKKLAMQFFTLVELGRADKDEDEEEDEEEEDDSVSVANKPKHLLDLFHSSFAVAKAKKKDAKAARKKKDAKAAREKQDYIKDDKSKKMQKRKKQKRKKMNTSSSSLSSLSELRMKTKYWVRSASALRSKGVKFIGINEGNPLDIQFNLLTGDLRVPTLCLNDKTATVLKNLVAYEQVSHLPNPYFTCLAIFFSNLAPTVDDIKLLREANIINHQPDDGALVLLLRQLYKASHNGFNACLINHHLKRIDRYLISFQARVKIFLTQKGGVANLVRQMIVSIIVSLFFHRTKSTNCSN
nr:UPF0481 protein At3g47200-like [Ipomoea batatas]GMC94123.1 UPF0481 protein At3g47200-like [Ipomoea batatas]